MNRWRRRRRRKRVGLVSRRAAHSRPLPRPHDTRGHSRGCLLVLGLAWPRVGVLHGSGSLDAGREVGVASWRSESTSDGSKGFTEELKLTDVQCSVGIVFFTEGKENGQ